jgi:predicted ATPase
MDYLKISNFKCFSDIDISINQLTVFAGANGNGKSTCIQALLFLRKTIESNFELFEGFYVSGNPDLNVKVSLNGAYQLALGNSSYVINRQSNNNKIVLGIFNEEDEITIDYEANNFEPQLFLTAGKRTDYLAAELPILCYEFYYLNAERIGPRINQRVEFYNYPNAGCQGEFTAQLISEKSGYLPIDKERLFDGTTNAGLEFQVNEWLNYVMPGVRITAKQSPETHTSQIQIENIYTKGDPILATNIGFGISYVLPIIANGLIAKKGSYFIVENPEAHLHPSAQTKIGRFLAMVAKAGVFVIIETHSDHIVNGIQLAVANQDISHDQVIINFFNGEADSLQPEIQPISISEKGELSDWPLGFFDQTQIDYAELFKLRKG